VRRMKIRSALFAILTGTSNAGPDASKLSDTDTQVVAHLHAIDQTEIAAGNLAQANGTDRGKAYGAKLVMDHAAFDAKLTTFAKRHDLDPIPDDTMQTVEEKRATANELTKLMALKGADFDKEIGIAMGAAHDKELTKADANLPNVSNPDLVAMLKTLKPTLQAHADTARKLVK
jgi:predicted outer membrane protein